MKQIFLPLKKRRQKKKNAENDFLPVPLRLNPAQLNGDGPISNQMGKVDLSHLVTHKN